MPVDRLHAWTQASWKLAGHARDHQFSIDVQDAGHLEASIHQLEDQYNDPNAREDMTLTRARALTRMWLFALYEALRAYRTACRRTKATDAWHPFEELFADLNAIRSPLAKHEVAGKKERHVTQATFDSGLGVGWSYFDPRSDSYKQTSRREIADRFLRIAASIAGAGEVEATRAAAAEGSDAAPSRSE